MDIVNVLTFSGGKDSTAMWLYAIEKGIKVVPVFCDTGHEHHLTYEYVSYLESKLGPIRRVKADFTERIAKKREYVIEKWPFKLTRDVPEYTDDNNNIVPFQAGLSEEEAAQIVETALSVLYPSGNPFLDLCLWKGRFPSRKAQFCTVFLKVIPTFEQVYLPLIEGGQRVISWQGVRAQESRERSTLPMDETNPDGYDIYRPLLNWKVEDVFEMHRRHNIEPNPLYKLGMSRVGCMPCINTNKAELFEIQRRFPAEVERVATWEKIVSMASKRQAASFFKHDKVAGNDIREWVEWSKTTRGGKNYDLLKYLESEDTITCSSQYGLCE
jgi:3'-phosphoadenosine 5'-phosphosulfate sulfotransferase (PAPS reductase)/FAD synthetase